MHRVLREMDSRARNGAGARPARPVPAGGPRAAEPPIGGLAALGLDQLERRARDAAGEPLPLRQWLALAEAWRIALALREARGNRSQAARSLGIGRRTLYTKMEKLGLVAAYDLSRERGIGAALACDGSPLALPKS